MRAPSLAALLLLAVGCSAPEVKVPDEPLFVGAAPQGIRFSEGGRYAWIALSGADEVCVVDCRRMRVVARHAGGTVPMDLAPVRRDEGFLVSQLQASELLHLSDDGLYGDGVEVAAGPTFFAEPTAARRTAVACRFDDELVVLDLESVRALDRFATGRRPGTPTLTKDGVLAFVPNAEAGTVTVLDLLNRETLATVPVGAEPLAGALTRDEADYVVACAGSGELVWVNTASFRVTARLAEGLGERPVSFLVSPDGRRGYACCAGSDVLSVVDLDARRVVEALPVGHGPSVARLHPEGRRLFVSNELDGTLSVLPVTGPREPGRGGPDTEVLVIGTIHEDHLTSTRYGLDFLDALVRAYDPDVVCVEIPPNRMEEVERELAAGGPVVEERVRTFPEYTEVLFPLRAELGCRIVPTAGWSASVSKFRRAALDRLSSDPARADDWRAYREATERSRQAIAQGGAPDDPVWIHSPGYDEAAEQQLAVYERLFSADLGPGGWEAINAGHFAHIERFLDEHRGEGLRVLVTYGVYHKGWLTRHLRRRDDVDVVDPEPYLERARRAVAGR